LDTKCDELAQAMRAVLTNIEEEDEDAILEWLLWAFCPCLLSCMGQPLFIIASTSWVEPVQLIPQVFNVFAINTLVPFLFMAVTSLIITSMLLRFNDKYQVSWQAQQAVMMFCMWIRSHMITDNASCKQWPRLTNSRYCPRNYIQSTKHCPALIATKNKWMIIGPIL
jgi:hypothetical protein